MSEKYVRKLSIGQKMFGHFGVVCILVLYIIGFGCYGSGHFDFGHFGFRTFWLLGILVFGHFALAPFLFSPEPK
jgi:hypothetical protein